MEHEPHSDTSGTEPNIVESSDTESNGSPEAHLPSIESLPETLGFVETDELRELHGPLMTALRVGDDEQARALSRRYHDSAATVVEQKTGDEYAHAQIGLIIALGLIRREAGQMDFYADDLQAALAYAWNMRLDDVSAVILAESAQVQAELQANTEAVAAGEPTSQQRAAACAEVLTAADCDVLAALPWDEALGAAYAALMENGVEDPEEYFRQHGIYQ